MNDKPECQKSIKDNTSDTSERKFGDTLNLVWVDTIDHVLLELDTFLKPLREQTEHKGYLCAAKNMLDTLQSCSQKIEILIEIEDQGHQLRQQIEAQPQQKA